MRDTLRFIGQMVIHPRQTGAIAPSGRSLARAMMAMLEPLPAGAPVVELGPGTGSITRHLCQSLSDWPLYAIERNARFVEVIRRRYARVNCIHGCAGDLAAVLAAEGIGPGQVGGVLSGLPLLSLPRDLVERIFAGLAEVLPSGGIFVNFTYNARAWQRFAPVDFEVMQGRRVLFNLPPARVMVLRRR